MTPAKWRNLHNRQYDRFGLGDIAVGTALGYLEVRLFPNSLGQRALS